MAFEDLLILALGGTVFFTIILPSYRFVRTLRANKRNAVKEAREQLEAAKAQLETARLQREVEHIYDQLYEETLEEDNQKEHKR